MVSRYVFICICVHCNATFDANDFAEQGPRQREEQGQLRCAIARIECDLDQLSFQVEGQEKVGYCPILRAAVLPLFPLCYLSGWPDRVATLCCLEQMTHSITFSTELGVICVPFLCGLLMRDQNLCHGEEKLALNYVWSNGLWGGLNGETARRTLLLLQRLLSCRFELIDYCRG